MVAPSPDAAHNGGVAPCTTTDPIMQSRNPLLDDLAKVTTGALSTLTTLKSELEGLARQQMERLLAQMDLVPRDEFEAVNAMAAKART